MKKLIIILIITNIKKFIYSETITKTVTPIEIESGEFIHLTKYTSGYMLIFHSSNQINKYIYNSYGILQNTLTCSKNYKYRNKFSSINQNNYFIIANNPPITFTDENNDCSELSGNVNEHGIRLAYFLNNYFTISNIQNSRLVLFHYNKENNQLVHENYYPEYDDNNAIKIDNNFLEMIGVSGNILLVFHTPNYNDQGINVKIVNTYHWNVNKSVELSNIKQPTNLNLLFLNYVTNDYDLVMYCYTTNYDEKLRCSCGYYKPNDNNNFYTCNIFEIISNCNKAHNDGFVNSVLIGNYNDNDGILVICQGSNKNYFHFTKLTFHQSDNKFSNGNIYSLQYDDYVSFPYYAPFINNDAIFYYYKNHACVTYLYSYTCKNVILDSIQIRTSQSINFGNYFIQGILESNSLLFNIIYISNEITLKKDSSVISQSDTVTYSNSDNFELIGNTPGTFEIKFTVNGNQNIVCSLSITLRSGCVEGCSNCDSNGVCSDCQHDNDILNIDNYYKKQGENPVICY